MNIVQAPNEILRTPTKPVDFSGPKLEKIIADMQQVLVAQKDPEGVGLAANQVGLSLSLFLARFGTKKNEPIRTFINPQLLDHSKTLYPDIEDRKAPLEGCLSKPSYYGVVQRFEWIKIRYQTLESRNRSPETYLEDTFKDFAATVIQHEIDHLNGKLFIERILEQGGRLYAITGKDSKGKEKWEEVELI